MFFLVSIENIPPGNNKFDQKAVIPETLTWLPISFPTSIQPNSNTKITYISSSSVRKEVWRNILGEKTQAKRRKQERTEKGEERSN